MFDGFVKSPFCPIFVIPAKAGIQLIQTVLDSCFRRSDGFSDFLRDHQYYLAPFKILWALFKFEGIETP